MNSFIDNSFVAPDISRRTLRREVIGMFALTFGMTFGLALLYFTTPIGTNPAVFDLLFYVAVFSPTIAAFIMTGQKEGWPGLRRLLSMLLRPTQYLRWIIVVLLLLPGAWFLQWVIETASGTGDHVDIEALLVTLPMLLFTTPYVVQDPGAIGEELGLRGYALPRLLALYPPHSAALIMGVLHGLWHLPVFFVASSAQSDLSLPMFMAWTIGLNVIWTWVFVWANGNVIISGMLIHLLFNVQGAAQVYPNFEDVGLTTCFVALLLLLIFPLKGYVQRA